MLGVRNLPQEPSPQDPAPTRFQTVELPPLVAVVTEYQGQARACPDCGAVTHQPIPRALLAHSVGPRLTATLSYFTGCHGVSKRGVEEIAEAVFDAPVALGTVANLEQEVSSALAAPHQEAVAAVQAAAVKHADETSWKLRGRLCWLWPAAILLAWLALDAAPRSFGRAQDIQRAALKSAEFGLLEPGKFHTFAHGSAVFYAESRDPDGSFRRVFLQRRVDERVTVVLADRARHEVEEDGALHVLVLYDGERYEGTPGQPELRRVRFAEHGIPVRIGDSTAGPARVETRPMRELMADPAPAAQAEFQRRLSLPLMALVLALLAVPLAELRPRQGRYARIGIVILVYFVYANLLSAAQTWIEKGKVAPAIGVWWVHALVLCGALWLWWRQSPPAWATR